MIESLSDKLSLVLSGGFAKEDLQDEKKLFGGRMGKPKVAICPECGEVSIYMEDVEKLKD